MTAQPPKGAQVIELVSGLTYFSFDNFETVFVIKPGAEYPRKVLAKHDLDLARFFFASGAAK